MRIAFYAPLKPPDHPVASGDRAMARALISALELAGHDVRIISRFRSFDHGNAERQARICAVGANLAPRLRRRLAQIGWRPDIWFTYHLYHKAPDWLGPAIAGQLGIPYVVAEASFAPKQAGGKWDLGHRAVADALARAAMIFQPNPADAECVLPLLSSPDRLVLLKPFLETAPFRAPERSTSRAAVGRLYDVPAGEPLLLTVAMMRSDQKLLSYRCLAAALAEITDLSWCLLLAGTGTAETEVRALFAPFRERIRWVGMLDRDTLRQAYRASDLYVWPAIKEAYGMAFVEAQAAGLAVVAGRSPGVAAIVADGETGRLVEAGDATAFGSAIRSLLADPSEREKMGLAAMHRAARDHDIAAASGLLDRHLRKLAGAR
jgi:glycosyltransferase involved in cell wall biosynthesis